jgi:tetratricopeptide (TPR) repeat protein
VFRKRPPRPEDSQPEDPWQPDPRQELAAATAAFEAGDLEHAANHTEFALVPAPTLPEAHEMLARLAAHPRGGSRLFPREERLALSRALARAHVLAYEREFDEALALLGMAQAFRPLTPWADVPWVTNPDTAAAADPGVVASLAVDFLAILRGSELDELRPAMRPYLRLVRNSIAAHPYAAKLHGAAAYFVRRFDPAEAAGYAERADRLEPCHASAVGLGMTYRDLGLLDDALVAFDRALDYQPDTLVVFADIVDMLFDADRLDEALSYARRALQVDPGYVCCKAAIHAIRFSQTRQASYTDALTALYKAQPEGSHEQGHIGRLMFTAMHKAGAQATVSSGTPRQVLRQTRQAIKRRPS